MSINQQHGKYFETIVLNSLNVYPFPVANAKFDIPFGKLSPTGVGSVKLFKKGTPVPLSDARRIFSWAESVNEENTDALQGSQPELILICGEYVQKGDVKWLDTIYEIRIKSTPESRLCLYGDLSLADIVDFHERIGLINFPEGDHGSARAFAKKWNKELLAKKGIINLNPKIDSKKQRRVQSSVALDALLSNISVLGSITLHDKDYRGITLPLQIKSSERTFND